MIMIMIIKIMIKIGKWKVTRSVYEGNRQYTQLKRRIKKTRRTRRKNSKKKKMQIMVLNTFPSSFTPSFTFILHSFLSLHPSLLPFPSSFTPSFTFILHSFLHFHPSLLSSPSSFTPSFTFILHSFQVSATTFLKHTFKHLTNSHSHLYLNFFFSCLQTFAGNIFIHK